MRSVNWDRFQDLLLTASYETLYMVFLPRYLPLPLACRWAYCFS